MATYTENYNLKMPSGQDAPDVEDFNTNAEIIDTVLKAHSDNTADEYSPDETYTAGRLVIQNNALWKAKQDINVAEAWTPDHWDPTTLAAELSAVNSRPGIPSGGTTGQVLTKQSNTDGDATWQNSSISEEQVGTAVENYFIEHPESTVNIPDGAVTVEKLSDSSVTFEKLEFGKNVRYGSGYFTGNIIDDSTTVYGSFGLIIECSAGETLYCDFDLSIAGIQTVQIINNIPEKNYGALSGVVGTIDEQEDGVYKIPNDLMNVKAAYFPIIFDTYPKRKPEDYNKNYTVQNVDFNEAKAYYKSIYTEQLGGFLIDASKNKLLYSSLFSAVSPMVGAKVYVSGDSITEQSASIVNNADSMYLGWYDRIAVKYNQEYECHGYGGQMWYSTSTLQQSAVADVKRIIDAAVKYDYIILEWGTNDITRGNFGSLDDIASDANDCGTVSAIRWCIENLQSNFPDTRIVVIMPCMRNGNTKQEQYYELVEPILKSYGVRRVYMAWDSGITIGMMNPDGIHFRYQDEYGNYHQQMTGIKKYSKCLEAEMLRA